MKKGLPFLLFFFTLACYGQEPLDKQRYLDSMQLVYSNSKSDSLKAMAAYAISIFSDSKSGNIKKYLELGRLKSRGNPFLEAVYWFYYGNTFWGTDNNTAMKMYLKADSLLSKINTKDAYAYRARSWRSYAAMQQHNDDSEGMQETLKNKAIPLAQKAGDKEFEGRLYMLMGMGYMNKWFHSKAEEYQLKGLALIKSNLKHHNVLVEALIETGKNQLYMDSAAKGKRYLDEAENILKPYPDAVYQLDLLEAKSIYYRHTGNYKIGLTTLYKAIAIAKKLNEPYWERSLEFQLYKIYTEMKNYPAAKNVLQKIIDDPKIDFANNRMMHFYEMAETYARMGDTVNAYKWLKQYNIVRDTIYIKTLESDIAEADAKFRKTEQEKNIMALQAANAKTSMELKNSHLTKWLFGAIAIACCIALIFFIYYYRNSKKMAAQKELNYRQALSEAAQKQQLATTEAILEGEERERRRVARDLHDGLGGVLAGIKIKLSGYASEKPQAKNYGDLDKIISQLDGAVGELRHIARNMMPESLLRFGLETALKDLCESYSNERNNIIFEPFGIDENMEASKQIVIYRIIQEALSNAIRHGKASNILVQCSQNGSAFFITVEDDGKGFDIKDAKTAKGIGLSNIETRAKYLHGKMDISSTPNEGTTLNIELYVAA